MKLKVDINNYLNNDYQNWVDSMNGLALGSPKVYFDFRSKISAALKREAVSNIYTVLYDLLRDGKLTMSPTGKKEDAKLEDIYKAVKDATSPIVTDTMKPSLSDQNINEIAISLAKTLNAELEKVVELVCPVSASDAANHRLQSQGNAKDLI